MQCTFKSNFCHVPGYPGHFENYDGKKSNTAQRDKMTHSATNLWHIAPSFAKVIDPGIHTLNLQEWSRK
jgi:hypothetical protein